MKKTFLIFSILLVLLTVIAGGIIYLNKVVLPVKIKALIISSLETATEKKVSLEALEFNIFKGLVLKNLSLSDGTQTLLSIREASCAFLIPPLFKKNIVIPAIRIDSPVIFLERRSNNTFEMVDLILNAPSQEAKGEFKVFIYKISIENGRIDFQDDTLSPAFSKSINNLDLLLRLSLPASVKFNLSAEIAGAHPIKLQGSGEFKIPAKELIAQIKIRDFAAQEFSAYYKDSGISILEGANDGALNLNFKDNILNAGLVMQNKGLAVSKDKIAVKLNAETRANIKYGLIDKKLDCSGRAVITNARVSGLGPIDKIENITSEATFNNSGVSLEKLNADVFGVPIKAKINVRDFQAPVVQLELSAPDFSLQSDLAVNNKQVKLTQAKGRYLNSEFLAKGQIDLRHPPRLEADLSGEASIDLRDIKEPLKKFKNQIEQIKPEGVIKTQFAINGNIAEIKSCNIKATLASPRLCAYNLNAGDFMLNYAQAGGLADISLARLALYDGKIEADAKMNLNSESLPWLVNANIQGVKIEKLKTDTAAKEKDIAGTISAEAKINGFSADPGRVSGAGKVLINEGRLWELNLFKGLGELIFAKDFANIVFNEASCGFVIQDKYIFSDTLKLKSTLVNLAGYAKIGFDSSLDASLNVEVLEESTPSTGTLKDVFTAIIGQAGKFGTIKISGTLKEPKHKFQAAVMDILRGLKDSLFGKSERAE